MTGGVATGLLLASLAGMVTGWFYGWGESPGAEWLEETWWLVVLSFAHGLLLLVAFADTGRRRVVVGLVPLVLAVGAGWAALTGNAPSPVEPRWPIVVASACAGLVGTVVLWWSERVLQSVPKRVPVVLLVGALGAVLIWAPAGKLRDAMNIESVTTDVALSAPVEGPFRNEALWNAQGHELAVSKAGVFASSQGRLVSLDPVTGKRRWTYTDAALAETGLRMVAGSTGEALFVAGSTGLVVLDAVTGEVRDRLDLDLPGAAGKQLLVYANAEATAALQAYDDTGEQKWRTDLPVGCNLGQMSWLDKVAVYGDRVYAAAFCPDGATVFSFRGDDGGDRRQAVVSDTDLLDCLRLAVASGQVAVRTCPDLGSGNLHSNVVQLLDPDDLRLTWRTELGEANALRYTGVAVDDRAVHTVGVTRTGECELLTLDIATGELAKDGELECVRDLSVSRGVLVARGTLYGIAGLR